MRRELTAERLRELLRYDPETGILSWRVDRGKCGIGSRAGDSAGWPDKKGYLRAKVDGNDFMCHRLAWLYVHGRWPAKQIDHINGVRDDNRIANLRECSAGENQQNQRNPRRCGTSGFLGVSFKKHCKKWAAKIKVCGKQKHIGYFSTPEEAHAAYLKAKAELHPFQTITHC